MTPPSLENGKKIKEELCFENLCLEHYKIANQRLPVLRKHIHWAIPWAGCVRWAEVQRYGRQGVTGSSERTVAGWPGCSATLGTRDSWHCGVHECYSTDWTLVKDNHLHELGKYKRMVISVKEERDLILNKKFTNLLQQLLNWVVD